jgi:hypothetical protein
MNLMVESARCKRNLVYNITALLKTNFESVYSVYSSSDDSRFFGNARAAVEEDDT